MLRHDEDFFTLITAAAARQHDRAWLERHLPAGGRLSLSDHSEDYGTLIVTGPQSRALLAGVAEADLTLPWLSHQPARVAGRPAALARVSFAGELGWEVHAANEHIAPIYEAILAAGAKPFGMFALDSLRIEKAYRAWKGDLSTDYTLLEAGLGRFLRLDKPADFPGKAALAAESETGPKKRFAPLIVEAGDSDAPYMSTVWKDGEIIGETTSGAWGYRVGASVALAVLRADAAAPGTAVGVEIYGERRPATVQPDRPLWDPENERLKA